MAASTLISSLKQVALFQGLSPIQITEIARHAERIIFKPGETIIAEGEDGDAAFIIVGGDAMRIEGPDLAGPEPVVAGSMVGEMAMLVETEHSSTVVARTPVRALKILRSAMLEHMTVDPAIADHLVERIAQRLNAIASELRAIDADFGDASYDAPAAEDGGDGRWPVRMPASLGEQRPGLDTRH
jgi:CRP-like cAMP-binding protein